MKVRNQPYLDAFGRNLKKLIEEYNTTPEGVASNGLIETKQVYRVLNGEHSPSLSTIVAIAQGLGVHPKELFDFKFE